MRLKLHPSRRESVSASSVLPVPGTPSRSVWPPASRHTSTCSLTRSWPIMTRFNCSRNAANFPAASATVSTLKPPISFVDGLQAMLKFPMCQRTRSGKHLGIGAGQQRADFLRQVMSAQATLSRDCLYEVLVMQRQRLLRLQRSVVQWGERADEIDRLCASFFVVVFGRTDGSARAPERYH